MIIAHSESVGMAPATTGGTPLPGPGRPVPAKPVHAEESTLPAAVTAPLRAKVLPDTLAPVFEVTLASARMFPANVVVVPSVAELPTCHDTLQFEPPITLTVEALAVVSVLPILKMKTALGLPWAFRVSVPVNCAELEKQ